MPLGALKKQVNWLSSIHKDLSTRPPLEHLADLPITETLDGGSTLLPTSKIKFHYYKRDNQEEYIFAINNKKLEIFDLQGNLQTLSDPQNVLSYLTTDSAVDDIKCLTLRDTTLILNSSVEVAMGGGASAYNNYALVFLKQADYSTEYTVTLDGTVSTHTTGSSTAAALSSKDILTALMTSLTGISYELCNDDTAVKIWKSGSAEMTISAHDGKGGDTLKCIYRETENFDDLPKNPDTFGTVLIKGSPASQADDYYVEYKDGNWTETLKPTLVSELDADTLPLQLIRETNGTFTIKPLEWIKRNAGDDYTCPVPEFVGMTLNNLFFTHNRLGFITDDLVAMSEAGELFNFFFTTALTSVASDPIYKRCAGAADVVELQNTVAFGDEFLFLSEFHQFKLDYGSEILSNETLEIMPVSQVVLNGRMQPAVISGELFFHNPARVFSSFLRYLTDDTKLKTAKSITDNVPSYIPSDVVQLAASEELKALTVLSGEAPEKIFVYRFYKDEDGNTHNTWGEFNVDLSDAFTDPRVLFQYFNEDQLFLVIAEDGYNFSFNRIDLNEGFDDELPRMDRLIMAKNLVYDPITNLTRMDNPYSGKPSNDFEIVAMDDLGKIELIVNSDTNSTAHIFALHDQTAKDVFVGFPYACIIQLPHIFPRNYFNDGRAAANLKGRLMLQKISFNYYKSGAFEVTVETKNRAARTYRQKLDILNMEKVDNNVFTCPLAGRNEETEITVKSSSVLPVHISSLAWQGNHNKNYKGRLG